MPQRIPIFDSPYFTVSMNLNNIRYNINLTYNNLNDFWTFNLLDESLNPIIEGVKIVSKYPFLQGMKNDDIFQGDFYCQCDEDYPTRNSFKDNKASLYYLLKSELKYL